MKLALTNKEAVQLFIRDERDRDRWERYKRQKRKYALPISSKMEQLKLALAKEKAKQLFIRDERDCDRWDRCTHETKAEPRFSDLKDHGAVEAGACEEDG